MVAHIEITMRYLWGSTQDSLGNHNPTRSKYLTTPTRVKRQAAETCNLSHQRAISLKLLEMAGTKSSIRLMLDNLKPTLVWSLQSLGKLQHKVAAIRTLRTRKASRGANRGNSIMHLNIATKSQKHAKTHHLSHNLRKVNPQTPEHIESTVIKRVTLKRRKSLASIAEILLHQRAQAIHLKVVTAHLLSLQILHNQVNTTTERILQRSSTPLRKRHQLLPKSRRSNWKSWLRERNWGSIFPPISSLSSYICPWQWKRPISYRWHRTWSRERPISISLASTSPRRLRTTYSTWCKQIRSRMRSSRGLRRMWGTRKCARRLKGTQTRCSLRASLRSERERDTK